MTKPTLLPSIDASLADFTKVAEKQSELRSRRAAIVTALAQAATPRHDVGSAAIALLDGEPVAEDTPTVDRDALEREASVLDRAIAMNGDRLRSAQAAHAGRLYADKREEHLQLVEEVIASFERLADAVQAEQKFREGFNAFSLSVVPRIRIDDVPMLKTLLQPRMRNVLRERNRGRFNLPATKKGAR